MLAASEIEPICPGIFLWRLYDPSVKADLFSTALETAAGTYLIDPVRLTPAASGGLASLPRIAGIVVTNENHERAAAQFSERFQVPVHLHVALMGATGLLKVEALQDRCTFSPGLTAVEIEGGPAGEIAVHFDASGGTMIVGDALINFEPYGFTLLPAKYCSNFKMMRRSLSKLLDYSFDRMLFAHGTPILSRARQRLEELLKEDR
jgi:glyoxylase-like metal-dependent hydrolase (beta-lactamase superfamily II)